jgi:hypothetical protein
VAALSTDLYLGDWELIPELSIYEYGPVPEQCLYRILRDGAQVGIHMDFIMPGGTRRTTAYAAPPTGSKQPYTGPGADSFALLRVDGRTLDSTAFLMGQEVGYARRVASIDAQLLVIVQQGRRQDGIVFRNFQVYRRV